MVSVSYNFVNRGFCAVYRHKQCAYENLDQSILKLSYTTETIA